MAERDRIPVHVPFSSPPRFSQQAGWDMVQVYAERLHAELSEVYTMFATALNASHDKLGRLPVQPHVTSPADGTMLLSTPTATTVLLDANQIFTTRGGRVVNTADMPVNSRTLTHVAGKIYHLRWTAAAGLRYYDVTDATYNPSALPEEDATFDSTYEDVLIARITTDMSNVPSITSLKNQSLMMESGLKAGTALSNANTSSASFTWQYDYNWGRTPKVAITTGVLNTMNGFHTDDDNDYSVTITSLTRYNVAAVVQYDYLTSLGSMRYICVA